MFTALSRRLRRLTNRPLRVRRTDRRAVPPWVEALEERALPSAYQPPAAIDLAASGHTANNGAVATNPCAISTDAHYAVFVSYATDLNVANFSGTLPGYDEVYLRDLVSGTTTLVSHSPDGTAAANSHAYQACISGNGQYVAFASTASNLVAGVGGTQIYEWNRATGMVSLVTVGTGSGGNNTSEYPSISSNGQVVAYDSNATDLVSGVANPNSYYNVYAYHLGSGATEMASIATDGTHGGNASSTSAQLSADGSTVTFVSSASNLDPAATDNNSTQDVYARKLSTSTVHPNTTYLVSAEVSASSTANAASSATGQAVSGDGRYEAFTSSATDLIPGLSTANQQNVYLRDRSTGAITLVSAALGSGGLVGGSSTSGVAVISADGRYVAFQSNAANLVSVPAGDHISNNQVYVWDRTTGAITLASPADDTATTSNLGGNNHSGYNSISISDAGQTAGGTVVVAYDSYASDLDPAATDSNGTLDVYAFNLGTGKVQLVSLATDGVHAGNDQSSRPVVSADGSTVTFLSNASNLDPNATDNNGSQDVYARKLSAAHAVLVSAEVSASSTANAASSATGQAVSGGGRYEAFTSSATDLIAGISTGGQQNAYLRDRSTGAITLVSAALGSGGLVGGNSTSGVAVVSADGRYVAFQSAATNLVSVPAGDHISYSQVYVWDRTTGAITLASPGDDTATTSNLGGNNQSGYHISISDAGQTAGGTVVVAYDSYASDLDPAATDSNGTLDVYAFNLGTGKVQLASLATDGVHSGNDQSSAPLVSADGSTVTFLSNASNLDPAATDSNSTQDVYARKLSAAHAVLVSAEVSASSTANAASSATGQAVSGGGRYEAFTSSATDLIAGISTGGQQNAYLRDRSTGAITLVSAALGSGGLVGGNSTSGVAVVSADGRYVAFQSAATNLVSVPAGDHISYSQVYVWDRTTGAITLASPGDDTATTSNLGGNNQSGYHISISDAGQTAGGTVVVAYDSYASDLDPAATDSNGTLDVYAFNLGTGKVQLASLATDGVHSGNDQSSAPLVSADGSTVTFLSNASNLDPAATDSNSTQDVYARKLSAAHAVLVSAEVSASSTANAASSATGQAVSGGGRYEAFTSSATDLIAGISTGGQQNAYLRDRSTGAITLVSAALGSGGLVGGNNTSDEAVVSADGRYVAFQSAATNLVSVPAGDHISYSQVYVWDRTTGAITLASPADDTATTNNLGGNNQSGYHISISDAGQTAGGTVVVAYDSYASDLDPAATDSNGTLDVYAFNLGTGKVQLASLASDGVHSGNDQSTAPVVSADGSTVAFLSNASNLDPAATDSNGTQDVYARKLSAAHPVLVSITASGSHSGDSASYDPAISASGRYVAFDSYDTNLTALPTGGNRDVYVRDLSGGATTLISVNTGGSAGGAGTSIAPSLSGDGSKVAFQSTATDLTAGVSSGYYNIYVRNWQGGSPSTTLETPNSGGTDGGNNHSQNPVLSADGSTVAFVSAATNLISGLTANGHYQVYVKPLAGATVLATAGLGGTGGNAGADTSTYVSLSATGSVAVFDNSSSDLVAGDNNLAYDVFDFAGGTLGVVSAKPAGTFSGNSASYDPAISASGRYVAFDSYDTNLSALPTGGSRDVYVRDLSTGATTLISVNSGGSAGGAGTSIAPSLSGDGSKVAFQSTATDLTAGVSSGYYNIYVRNWQGGSPSTTLETPNSAGTDGGNSHSQNPVLSADGSTVAFVSAATNLISGLTANGHYQVYVKPLAGATVLATAGLGGTGGNANADTSTLVSLSATGSVAVFDNSSSDLVAGDNNLNSDVFDFAGGTLGVVSAKPAGTFSGNSASYDPAISASGRYVAFDSNDTNLTALPTGGSRDVYVRDLSTGATTLISVNSGGSAGGAGTSYAPSLSGDGSKVAFQSTATDLTAGVSSGYYNIYVRNWQGGSPSTTLETPNSGGTDGGNSHSQNPVLSADGSTVAFVSAATNLISGLTANGHYQVYVKPLAGATVLATAGLGGTGGNAGADTSTYVSLSATGSVAVFDNSSSDLVAGDNNLAYDVFDFAGGTLGVVSAKPAGTFSGNSASYDPAISASGRYVAFDSYDTNLSALPTGGSRDVYIRDLSTGATTLISVNTGGSAGGAGTSIAPSLSGDGSKVAFQSTATDLTAGVSSGYYNIYVRNWQGGSPSTTLETPNSGGTDGGNSHSQNPVLSADGSTVAFVSAATNLISGVTTNGLYQVYVKPLAGAPVLATAGLGGTGGNAQADTSAYVSLSKTGGVAVFDNNSSNLVAGDNNLTYDVFDFAGGTLGVVSAKPAGTFSANGAAYRPVISANGQYVAFDSPATNLSALPVSGYSNVYVRDLNAGATTLISVNSGGSAGGAGTSYAPSLSGDGSKVAFESSATDLTAGVSSGYYNIYVRNWQGGSPSTALETPNSGGTDGGNSHSYNPALSADGSTVAFVSAATNLLSGVTANGNWQVYVKPLTGALALISPGPSGTGGNGNADTTNPPAINSNGTALLYDSAASDLVANDTNATTDVFFVTTALAVSGIAVNGNSVALAGTQRSMVSSIVYTFNHPVTLAAGAFTIALHPNVTVNGVAQPGGYGTVPTLAWASGDGGVTWVVTFSGSGVVNHSIADGIYDITLHAADVTAGAQALSADHVDTFYRLFGDADGNHKVNNADLAVLASAFNKRSNQAGYLAYLDYDGNGVVNNSDLAQFANRFNTAFTGFTPTI